MPSVPIRLVAALRLLIMMALVYPLAAISPDQTLTERVLKENRYFLTFLNIAVSNFGNEKDIKLLKEANQSDFNANLWYLQSDYPRAFREIRKSQEVLRDVYYDLLIRRYNEDARALLDISAPIIIQSKDKKAEHFLKLGYRDLASARVMATQGYNSNRFLFSTKVKYYIDAIKLARRAKRFAFLALIESKTPVEEKDDYRTQTINEALGLETNEEAQVRDYERVRDRLTNMINRKLFQDTYSFFLHHDDNYTYISEGRVSILSEALKELKTDQVDGRILPADTKPANPPATP